MRRKILIIIMIALLILTSGLFVKKVYEDKAEVFKEEIENILQDINELSTKLNRYELQSTGTLAISANYKGAHGENFPHDFTFNYALEKNKIYFENEDGYNSLSLNKKLLGFIKGMTKKIDASQVTLSNTSINFTNPSIDIETKYLNEIYNTNFQKIKSTIYFENVLSKKIDRTVIQLDDITITKTGKSYIIEIGQYNIKFNFNKKGYSLNINDNIKMNVFNETTNDRYTLVVGAYVYSFTVNNSSIDFVASTGASIYNSINIVAKYGKYELKREKELAVVDNPITRYFSEVK